MSGQATPADLGPDPEPARDVADELIKEGLKRVPDESPFKRILAEAGWLGLVFSVLFSNVPVTVLVSAFASGKAALNMDALELYAMVFVAVAPFVIITAALTFASLTDQMPQWPPQGYLFVGALMICGGSWLSLGLGGVVPAEVINGPVSASPSGLGTYILESIGAYLLIYGPIPLIAGMIQGFFFGRWGAVLDGKH
jgi:hypothetical protein